jgi:hypothetical protein
MARLAKHIRNQANLRFSILSGNGSKNNVYKNRLEIMRLKVAWEAMKAVVTSELRTDTSTPM